MTWVLVVGGYGAVGRHAADGLRGEPGVEVIVAGRHPSPDSSAVRLDVGDAAALAASLDGVDAVLMCAERDNAAVARACFERGVHYVDVSASPGVLTEIEGLDELARHHRATAVLSVGLAPGVTNLLARHVMDMSGVSEVDIGVLIGAGEHHGPAAIAWTLDGLGELDGSWTMPFPAPFGDRTVHRFPFSDQSTLPATLGITAARTGLALDSRLTTALIAAAGRPAVARFLRRPRVRAALLAALARIHLGSDGFAVVARAGTVRASFGGRSQSRATGLVAAALVLRLDTMPVGVAHVDQLVEPVAFLTELADVGGFGLDLDPGGRHF